MSLIGCPVESCNGIIVQVCNVCGFPNSQPVAQKTDTQQLKDSISLVNDLRTCINCSDATHREPWLVQVDGIIAKLESI